MANVLLLLKSYFVIRNIHVTVVNRIPYKQRI